MEYADSVIEEAIASHRHFKIGITCDPLDRMCLGEHSYEAGEEGHKWEHMHIVLIACRGKADPWRNVGTTGSLETKLIDKWRG